MPRPRGISEEIGRRRGLLAHHDARRVEFHSWRQIKEQLDVGLDG